MNNINDILQENKELKLKNADLEKRLQKYTNGDGHKRYYEKNKDTVKDKGKTYLQKLKDKNPEKLKEYRHTAYLNRKAKLQNELNPHTS
jgi:regulator of replication initiation timing